MTGTTGGRHRAERHRVHGELLLRQTVPEGQAAEACFQQALDVARQRQAKSWELRAAHEPESPVAATRQACRSL